jgi:hypothetical protein
MRHYPMQKETKATAHVEHQDCKDARFFQSLLLNNAKTIQSNLQA